MQLKSKHAVVDRYGNAASTAQQDPELLLGQSEAYVEYDRLGRVVKGQEAIKKSRYAEDVYINNHTAVWGSWWRDGSWGYACCHQSVKNSYCTGQAGRNAMDNAAANASE